MIDFIMTNLPIIVCFVLGIGLLIMEALMPGFGIAGFSGIALEVVALVLTWQQHGTMATLGMLLIVLSVLAIAISKENLFKKGLRWPLNHWFLLILIMIK